MVYDRRFVMWDSDRGYCIIKKILSLRCMVVWC